MQYTIVAFAESMSRDGWLLLALNLALVHWSIAGERVPELVAVASDIQTGKEEER